MVEGAEKGVEHADPRLLEEILGQLASPGKVQKIAEQAVLVLLD